MSRRSYQDIPLPCRPVRGVVTRQAFRFAVAWLDGQGIFTKITKQRGVPGYNIYTNEYGEFKLVSWCTTHYASRRYVYELFYDKYKQYGKANPLPSCADEPALAGA
jgi:hypothetical protein